MLKPFCGAEDQETLGMVVEKSSEEGEEEVELSSEMGDEVVDLSSEKGDEVVDLYSPSSSKPHTSISMSLSL